MIAEYNLMYTGYYAPRLSKFPAFCGSGLRKFFNLGRSLPRRVWLEVTPNWRKDSYKIRLEKFASSGVVVKVLLSGQHCTYLAASFAKGLDGKYLTCYYER